MLCATLFWIRVFHYSTMLAVSSIKYIPMYLITAQSAVRCNTKHIVQWGGPFLQSGDPLIVSSQETPDLWSGGSRLLVFRVPCLSNPLSLQSWPIFLSVSLQFTPVCTEQSLTQLQPGLGAFSGVVNTQSSGSLEIVTRIPGCLKQLCVCPLKNSAIA